MSTNDLLDVIIKQTKNVNKPTILIGVDGAQGVGKTTLLVTLDEKLKSESDYNVISLGADFFLAPRAQRDSFPEDFHKNASNLHKPWDFDQMAKVLHHFLASENTTSELTDLYNHKTGKRDKKEIFIFTDKNIILVGGPCLLYPNFPPFDIKIFLGAKTSTRYANAMARAKSRKRSPESQDKIFNKFENFYRAYFTGKLHLYDLVVDYNNFDNPIILGEVNEKDILR